MTAMLRLRPGAPVRLRELDLEALPVSAAAQGLEGQVTRATNATYLCKMFTAPRDARGASDLQQLIDFREWGGTAEDREIMRTSFSWPLHRVLDGPGLNTVGVLIPPAEPRFYFEHEGEVHLREGQHLPRARTVAGRFDLPTRLGVLIDLAVGWDMLARNGLVYGDANSRNIVFAVSGSPSVFFLDCDGIRDAARAPGPFRAQASWADPFSGGNNSLESDSYLFALWVLRVLSSAMTPAPSGPVDIAGLDPQVRRSRALVALLRSALGPRGARPSPGSFLPALRSLRASTSQAR